MKGGKAKYPKWVERIREALVAQFRPVHAIWIPADAVPDPETFVRSSVDVEALVKYVAEDSVIVGDWFDYVSVRVSIVGLRASISVGEEYESTYHIRTIWTGDLKKAPPQYDGVGCPGA